MSIRDKISTVPNWPKDGVMFRDITSLFKDPEGLKLCLDDFVDKYKERDIDLIVGIDSRGFLIGPTVAYRLGIGFVPIRKKGKLPPEIESQSYTLEYGEDVLEIKKDSIKKSDRVLIIDDLIATGGTALAATNLVKKIGGDIVELAFIIDLPDLGGGKKLLDAGFNYYAQTSFNKE